MQEQTLNAYAMPTQVAGLAQANSPLQGALNLHGEELAKLFSLFDNLEVRLSPVRNSSPQNGQVENLSEPVSSPVVGQVAQQTRLVLQLSERVNELLRELEV